MLEDRELGSCSLAGIGGHPPIELAERVLELRVQRATLAAGLALDRTAPIGPSGSNGAILSGLRQTRFSVSGADVEAAGAVVVVLKP